MDTTPAPDGSEFVLDDGLDEDVDEDLLAFQSERAAAQEAAERVAIVPPPRPPSPSNPPPPAPTPPAATAAPDRPSIPALSLALGPALDGQLLLEGLPVGCTRADVEALVGPGALRAIRLGPASAGVYGPTVVSASAAGCEHALALHAATVRGAAVRVRARGAAERLQDVLRGAAAGAALPLGAWAAAAERARAGAAAALADVDARFALRARAGIAGAAVAGAAQRLDRATGASRGAGAVAGAVAVAAGEVDESWRLSERARAAVNGALRDDRLAPAARAVVAAVAPPATPSRKDYRPSAERRNPDPDPRPAPAAKLEF